MDEKQRIQENQYVLPYHWFLYQNWGGRSIISLINNPGRFWYISGSDTIRDIIVDQKPRKYLDVGCGDGRLVGLVKEKDANILCSGADISARSIELAKGIFPNAKWFAGDFKEINETFDVVSCIETLEHIPDDQIVEFVKGLFEKVDKGGSLVISVPTIAIPVEKKHYRHYSRELLIEQLNLAKIDYSVQEILFMHKESAVSNWFYKICGKYANYRVAFIEKMMWKHYDKKCKYGENEEVCARMVAVVRKKE